MPPCNVASAAMVNDRLTSSADPVRSDSTQVRTAVISIPAIIAARSGGGTAVRVPAGMRASRRSTKEGDEEGDEFALQAV